jgi:hypothetical protein
VLTPLGHVVLEPLDFSSLRVLIHPISSMARSCSSLPSVLGSWLAPPPPRRFRRALTFTATATAVSTSSCSLAAAARVSGQTLIRADTDASGASFNSSGRSKFQIQTLELIIPSDKALKVQ